MYEYLSGWGDFKRGGYQPEISLAKEIAKIVCEGHPLVKFCTQNEMPPLSNHPRAG
jgi:hypothetical protein